MSLRYHLIYYAVACLLGVLVMLIHPVFLVLLIIYAFFIIRHFGWGRLVTIGLVMIFFLVFIRWPQPTDEPIISGYIISRDEKSIILKTTKTKIKVYGEFIGYEVGDELEIEVNYFEISRATNDNAFDYRNYLYSQGITNNASLLRLINSQKHNTLFQKLQKRIDGKELVNSYASMFILGIRDEMINDYYHQLTELSIVHLFALSGLHIHILRRLIKKVLIFLLPEYLINYLSLIIIGVYMYIIPYNISFMRAYLVMLLMTLFKKYLNQLDCFSLVAMFFVFMNPYIIYNLSFVFSYFMYLIIILINHHRYLNEIVYGASVPIVISIQYRINILSLFLGIILTPLISVLYQLLWLYVIFGNFFKPVISLVIEVLDNIVVFSTDFSFFINFSKPSLFFILGYYYIYFKLIVKINIKQRIHREILLLLSLVIMFYFKPYYQTFGQVVMIDVGQGDCFFIQQPYNQGNILIDTWGLRNKDLAALTLVPYLRSVGVFKLDHVFISHDDFDHSGAYQSLADQIEIGHTITSYQDKFKIGQVEIEILKTPESTDNNDSSLVLLVTINKLKYLFTGDISNAVERQLINDYPELKIDVLKVSHHGSNTGTSAAFLNAIKPKIALISCGKDNYYGHPHDDVITRLNDYGVKVYRSDEMGMVKIVYYGNDNYIFNDFND